jgi:hypothetical protein
MERVTNKSIQFQRNFFNALHKRPNDPKEIRPYVFIWDGLVHVALTTQFPNTMKAMRIKVPNSSAWETFGPLFIKFYSSHSAMISDMLEMENEGLKTTNPKEFKAETKYLKNF